MTDAATWARLHDVARRLSRSELLFVGQASPWTTGRRQSALTALQEIIGAETQALHSFLGWLVKQRKPASNLGTFPAHLTGLSYLTLDHLLPRLVASQRTEIALLESDLAALSDLAARDQVSALLELKKSNLFRLEILVSEGAGV